MRDNEIVKEVEKQLLCTHHNEDSLYQYVVSVFRKKSSTSYSELGQSDNEDVFVAILNKGWGLSRLRQGYITGQLVTYAP